MATKQVHTSRGRIIRLNPTQNSKLIKTFSDTGALSLSLYEQVCCIFRGDFANKVRTFRDKSESAGLFAGEKEVAIAFLERRAVWPTVCLFPLLN